VTGRKEGTRWGGDSFFVRSGSLRASPLFLCLHVTNPSIQSESSIAPSFIHSFFCPLPLCVLPPLIVCVCVCLWKGGKKGGMERGRCSLPFADQIVPCQSYSFVVLFSQSSRSFVVCLESLHLSPFVHSFIHSFIHSS